MEVVGADAVHHYVDGVAAAAVVAARFGVAVPAAAPGVVSLAEAFEVIGGRAEVAAEGVGEVVAVGAGRAVVAAAGGVATPRDPHLAGYRYRLRDRLGYGLRLRDRLGYGLRLRDRLGYGLRLRDRLGHGLRLRDRLGHGLRLGLGEVAGVGDGCAPTAVDVESLDVALTAVDVGVLELVDAGLAGRVGALVRHQRLVGGVIDMVVVVLLERGLVVVVSVHCLGDPALASVVRVVDGPAGLVGVAQPQHGVPQLVGDGS